MGPWASYLSTLRLTLLICKMGIIVCACVYVCIEQDSTCNSALHGVSMTLVLTAIDGFELLHHQYIAGKITIITTSAYKNVGCISMLLKTVLSGKQRGYKT